ncbi:MAG: anthranilate phosphoribosyltransferase, partial [Candidatus Omnitrophota bacterium]
MLIKEAIKILNQKRDLDREQMQGVMLDILGGVTDNADIIAFLTLLNDKGETVEELTAAIESMLKYVDPIIVDRPNILDTCG